MTETNIPGRQTGSTPRIVAADKLSDGLVIQFDSGACGFYSDAYLFSKLAESTPLDEDHVEW